MGKKVLIISASPRRSGNSDLLCDEFMAGAKEAGHDAEKIFLHDFDINFCRACYACQKNGGICVINDDVPAILTKMKDADIWLLATPIYFYNMDGQLKTLIDRVFARFSEMSGKTAYFIATSEDPERKSMCVALEGFRAFLYCLNNVEEGGYVFGTGVGGVGEIIGHPAMKEAYLMGKNIE